VETALPIGIWKDEAAPAAAVERFPLAFRLGETTGHCVNDGRLGGENAAITQVVPQRNNSNRAMTLIPTFKRLPSHAAMGLAG
jgi:hypothetical protein